MEESNQTAPGWLVAGVLIAVLAAGCGGCDDAALDRFEEWLQSNPERPGKVGTLRALEVERTARDGVDERVRRGEGPCDIGWRLDEPFAVDFELTIEVDGRHRDRRWSEQGSWQRDEAGRWMIENDVAFADAEDLQGERHQQIFSDEEGLWEWLGPDVAVRHDARGPARRHWRRAFGARFGELMALVDERWGPADDGADRWSPGGDHRRCGPSVRDGEASEWRPLVESRGSSHHALVVAAGGREDDGTGECRRLEAAYGLRAGAEMEIELRECARPEAPEVLDRPEVDRVVEARRDRRRASLDGQLREWIEEGLVETIDESTQQ